MRSALAIAPPGESVYSSWLLPAVARATNSFARSGSQAYGSANGSMSRSTSPGGVGTSGTPADGPSVRVRKPTIPAAISTTVAASSTKRGTAIRLGGSS